MKYLKIICFLFLGLNGVAQKQFIVDPDAVIREITGSFSSIKVSSGLHVYLSKGEVEVLAISATDEKYRNAIKTEIRNGVLHVFFAGEKIRNNNSGKLTVYIAYKNLEQLQASGASDIFIAGIMELPLLNLQLSGASQLRGQIKVDELNMKLSGASEVKLSGIVKNINIESSGASDVKSYDLTAENCNVKASGASDVNITITKELTANASGASNVFYKGTGELKVKQSSGASSVAKVE